MSTMPMSNVFRVVSLSIIFDIHDGATIVTISMVDDMLDSSIRKVDLVLSLDITSLISRPYFTKVCVILVIMNSILEVERIWSLIIMISTMTSTMTSNTSKCLPNSFTYNCGTYMGHTQGNNQDREQDLKI